MLEAIWLIFLLFLEVLLFGALLICISMCWQALFHVPWVRTPKRLTAAMFELADLQPGERVLDLGSGDGSIVLDAVRAHDVTGVGIEGRWDLVLFSRWRARKLRSKAEFFYGNFFRMELPPADVILVYLFSEVNKRLEPILMDRYPSGTRVVSRVFTFPNLPLEKKVVAEKDSFYLYRIP